MDMLFVQKTQLGIALICPIPTCILIILTLENLSSMIRAQIQFLPPSLIRIPKTLRQQQKVEPVVVAVVVVVAAVAAVERPEVEGVSLAIEPQAEKLVVEAEFAAESAQKDLHFPLLKLFFDIVTLPVEAPCCAPSSPRLHQKAP